jgi:hypothetical protein
MDRMRAYAEIAADLERFRRLPYEELARRIGDLPIERSVESQEGPVTIEVCFGWEGAEGGPIRVSATAYGPSWWRLDRLEEAVTVKPPDRNA